MSRNKRPSPEMPPCSHEPRPYLGPTSSQVREIRAEFTNPAIFAFYKDPLMIVEGRMQYLYDETGRRYLDLFAGIVTVSCGHCHPHVTDAICEQVQTLQHTTTIYMHPHFGEYAKRLAAKLPEGLDVTYFVNSGSEANDLAIMMARLYTGNFDILALQNAYHGTGPSAMGSENGTPISSRSAPAATMACNNGTVTSGCGSPAVTNGINALR